MQSLVFRVQGSGFRIHIGSPSIWCILPSPLHTWSRVSELGFSNFEVSGFGFMGFRFSVVGFGAWGLG